MNKINFLVMVGDSYRELRTTSRHVNTTIRLMRITPDGLC